MTTMQIAFENERETIQRIVSRGDLAIRFSEDGTALLVDSLLDHWRIEATSEGDFCLFHQNYDMRRINERRGEVGYHVQKYIYTIASALIVVQRHDMYRLRTPENISTRGLRKPSRKRVKRRNDRVQANHVLDLIEAESRRRRFSAMPVMA